MSVFQTYAVICFSLILYRNLSKKYQPKKKEEDENKYVYILILDLFGVNPDGSTFYQSR